MFLYCQEAHARFFFFVSPSKRVSSYQESILCTPTVDQMVHTHITRRHLYMVLISCFEGKSGYKGLCVVKVVSELKGALIFPL